MTVGSFTLYSNAVNEIGTGAFNLSTDTIQCILATTSYTPNANTDILYSAVSANEVANGLGYTTGGVALSGVVWTLATATNTFAANSPSWSTATFAFRYGVLIRATGGLISTSKLLGYIDLNTGGGNITATGGIVQINWNNASTTSAAGTIFTATHTP